MRRTHTKQSLWRDTAAGEGLKPQLAMQELVASQVFRIYANFPITDHISWRVPGVAGQESWNTYILTSDTKAVIVDAGVGRGMTEYVSMLQQVVGGRDVELLVTTRLEPDCLANLDTVVAALSPRTIYAPGGLDPLDFFEDQNTSATLASMADVSSFSVKREEVVDTLGPDRRVRVAPSLLRTLPTLWLHDEANGIVFTSDTFSHVTRSHAPALDRPGTYEEFRSHMIRKFDWIPYAERFEPIADWVVDQVPTGTRCIAPTRGAPIIGAAHVSECREMFKVLAASVTGNGGSES